MVVAVHRAAVHRRPEATWSRRKLVDIWVGRDKAGVVADRAASHSPQVILDELIAALADP